MRMVSGAFFGLRGVDLRFVTLCRTMVDLNAVELSVSLAERTYAAKSRSKVVSRTRK